MARAALGVKMDAARGAISRVSDEPGGGFRLHATDGVSMRTGGLGARLAAVAYSKGPEMVTDAGPSCVSRGLLVHRHMFHYVECITFGAPCECAARFRKLETATAGVAALVRHLRAIGLAPVASEVALVAPAWDLATRADLVCTDADGELVLVSIKTGAGDAGKTDRRLRAPFEHIVDSGHARHQLQLLAEYVLMCAAGACPKRAVVAYVSLAGDAVDTRAAAGWWWNDEDARARFSKAMGYGL